MKKPVMWGVVVATGAVLLLIACTAPQGSGQNAAIQPTQTVADRTSFQHKIADNLKAAMVADPQSVEFFVTLTEQASYPDADNLAGAERKEYVARRAEEVANRTQPPVRVLLDQLKVSGDVTEYKSYTIFNGFFVKGKAVAVNALASRQDVEALTLNSEISIDPVVEVQPEPTLTTAQPSVTPQSRMLDAATPTPEWNVNLVNAPTAWAQPTSYKGQNITVGIIDTGVDGSHPALQSRWRGTIEGTSNFNWYNAVDPTSSRTPYDDNGHGTHVTGIILGQDGVSTLR